MSKKAKGPRVETFDAWLKSKNMTTWDFAVSVDVPQSTIVKWRQNEARVPRGKMRDAVKKIYPDCPVLARK